ncbi:MAG: EAL domain-containing protein [Caldimonas sp.]
MQSSPQRSVRLLKYQSKPSSGVGVEVIFDAEEDIHLLLDDLRWLTDLAAVRIPTEFFVLALWEGCSTPQLLTLAQDAVARGLAAKLCITVSARERPADDVLSELQSLGIRVLLGGIGSDARFCDIADSLIDGIVVDSSLVSSASGDPRAASVLEAITTLARNMGLRTFASRCSHEAELDYAMSCGVDFLTLEINRFAGVPMRPAVEATVENARLERPAHQ